MSNVSVYDQNLLTGDHQVSLVTVDGVLTYVVLENKIHLTMPEFEEIVRRVEDFEERQEDVGSE